MTSIVLIVEDQPSGLVAAKILKTVAPECQIVNQIRWSKDMIRTRIRAINRSARGCPFFVLTDQDTLDRCPPRAIAEVEEPIHANLLCRFATMEVESWILADRARAARFLQVPEHRIPLDTDRLPQPKEFLVSLARKSRSSSVRRDLVPRPRSTSRVGPDYNGRLRDFVIAQWDVRTACEHSPSLRRTVARVEAFPPDRA